jgi:hypothetical protein
MKAQKVKRLFAALIHFYKCFDAAAGGGLNTENAAGHNSRKARSAHLIFLHHCGNIYLNAADSVIIRT